MKFWEKSTILSLIIIFSIYFISIEGGFASHSATVSVTPQHNSLKVGETFVIEIKVENVSGLQGFDFCLKYPSAILNVSKVEEGPFLASFGTTFIAKMEIEEDYQLYRGRVWLAIAICGDGFADGNGVLAKITFEALSDGEEALDLFSVSPYRSDKIKLVTCGPEPIPHTVLDGYVEVLPSDDPPNDPPADPPGDSDPSPDVNGDGKIDIADVASVAKAYGKWDGEPGYSPKADLDQNGTVDILDIAAVAAMFGKVL